MIFNVVIQCAEGYIKYKGETKKSEGIKWSASVGIFKNEL